MNHAIHIGNFSSSEIVALTTNGKTKGSLGAPALSYIKECNMERRLGRPLEKDVNAKALSWGNLVERQAFDKLGTEYRLCSQETLQHPFIDCWLGSPDGEKFDEGKTVIDIKSPITLKSFCTMVDPLYNGKSGWEAIQIIRDDHKEGEKYYQQLVSNAVLTKAKFAELVVYLPFYSDLNDIKLLAARQDEDLHKYYWINNAREEELPFLIDGGFYNDVNIIRFEIPEADKIALINRVKECATKLIPWPQK